MVATAPPDDDISSDLADREQEAPGDTGRDEGSSRESARLDDLSNLKFPGFIRSSKGRIPVGADVPQSKKYGSNLKKWLLLGGAPTIGLLIAGIVLLLFLANLLKIPNLASYMTEYAFANVIRDFGSSADRTVEESLAAETADTTLYEQIAAKFKGVRDGMDDKILKQLSPDAAMRVLGRRNNFELVYKTNSEMSYKDILLGRKILKSISLDGESFEVVPQRGFLRSFIPKVVDIPYLAKEAKFAQDFAPALRDSLRLNEVNPIVRGLVARQLRQELGINLIAWHVGDFAGKNAKDARYVIEEEAYKTIAEDGQGEVAPSKTPDIQSAEEEALKETNAAVHDESHVKLQQAIDNAGVAPGAVNAIEATFDDNILKEVVSFINPFYAIALPACIVYEGSLDTAGPSINQSVAAQQKSYYFIASAADQQKAGYFGGDWQAQATAVGAMNDKLGDISQSNAYLRATGQQVDTSATSLSSEAGAMQDYTLIDATPLIGGSAVGDSLKSIADGACPYFSDLKFGLATGVLLEAITLVLDIPSGGGASAGEIAVEAGADAAAETAAKSFATRFFEHFLGEAITKKAVAGKLRSIITKGLGDAVKIAAITMIAKLVVMARAGQWYNGLEQGADMANTAESGAIIHAGEISRHQNFGRPLTCSEIIQMNKANRTFLAEQNAKKSFADRYLAITNPDSLLTRTAVMVSSQSSAFMRPGTILNFFSGPFSPFTVLGNLFGTAYADSTCSQQDYGNVRFGWSEAERDLANSDNSYLPLENQQTLDQSGKEDEIAKQYAVCFGYGYNDSGTSLDPTNQDSRLQSNITEDGAIGTLLAGGSIVRSPDGDIITDQGLCSPQNLGVHNPTYGDLVYRWRLAMSYDTAINQITNTQTVSDAQ